MSDVSANAAVDPAAVGDPAAGGAAPVEAPAVDPAAAPAGAPDGGTPPPAGLGIMLSDDIDADLPEGIQQFDRPYVEKVRAEAANRRVALKPYEDVFGGASEPERDALLHLNQTLLSDPEAGVKMMLQLSRDIAGDSFDSLLTAEPAPLTQEDVDRMFTERQQAQQAQQAQQDAEAAVFSKITELGYEKDTPEAANLVWRSYHQHGGDMDAAHAAVQADKQKVIDEYLAEKAKTNGGYPPVAQGGGGGGPADGSGGPPKTLADARASAEARIAARAGA